eukprot:4431467-Pleurochrysis_carterae.AAC.1
MRRKCSKREPKNKSESERARRVRETTISAKSRFEQMSKIEQARAMERGVQARARAREGEHESGNE